ncbi:MAG: DUF3465 domain-containing protein [Cyanobacteria bacterium REEB65]|nr:DUF3465 domain-containing protein [Cyanobacteria bacterium REEB65]
MGLRGSLFAIPLAALLLAGCGGAVGDSPASLLDTTSSVLTEASVPPQSQFTTIQCTVIQLMPEDTKGLPHQRFMVELAPPQAGVDLEVDNDLTYGELVPNLQVGEDLTIRGVEYHDPGKDGIHWTHHASVAGDAGFIQTPDGQIYQ